MTSFFFIMYNIVRVMTLCNKRATNYYRRSNCVLPNVNCVKTELESTGAAILNRVIDRPWRTLYLGERETRPSRSAAFVRLFVNVSFSFRKCLKKEFHIEMRFLIYI